MLPKDFLSVAEETGLIIPLGGWVIREACRQVQRWHEQIPSARRIGLSVNLSDKQFRQPDLVEQIASALEDSGLDPAALRLELTENVVVEEEAPQRSVLRRLKQLGVQLHIDDFGTGLSSLSMLHRLPLDTLKMDRSFVSRMTEDPKSVEVIEAILNVARALQLDVVAEGVETAEQLDELGQLGCEYVQGFLYSRPVPARAARLLVAETHHPRCEPTAERTTRRKEPAHRYHDGPSPRGRVGRRGRPRQEHRRRPP